MISNIIIYYLQLYIGKRWVEQIESSCTEHCCRPIGDGNTECLSTNDPRVIHSWIQSITALTEVIAVTSSFRPRLSLPPKQQFSIQNLFRHVFFFLARCFIPFLCVSFRCVVWIELDLFRTHDTPTGLGIDLDIGIV